MIYFIKKVEKRYADEDSPDRSGNTFLLHLSKKDCSEEPDTNVHERTNAHAP